ncbi:MAG: hypothetical protein ABIC68_07645 [Candidatus Omnitrophota bacterium]
MKKKSAVIALIIFLVLVLAFVLFLPVSALFGLDVALVIRKNPLFGFFAGGGLLIVFGLLLLIFQNEAGMWSAEYRQGIADKYPAWKKMSGLTEEKVRYYFSFEFNRRMVVVGAWINLVIGLVLIMAAGILF